jgi:hypothetical protein
VPVDGTNHIRENLVPTVLGTFQRSAHWELWLLESVAFYRIFPQQQNFAMGSLALNFYGINIFWQKRRNFQAVGDST